MARDTRQPPSSKYVNQHSRQERAWRAKQPPPPDPMAQGQGRWQFSTPDSFYEQLCGSVDRSQVRKSSGKPFWREDDPVIDKDGKVIKGGMWDHQRELWNLPNFIKILVGGLGCLAGDTLIDCPRDLEKYPKGIPIKDLVGQQPWVYAWQDGRI